MYGMNQNITSLWQNTFYRFILIGILNTIFGYGVYAALILTSVEYHVALTVSTILGVLFNFKTTGTIVFRNNKKRLIFRFVVMYGIIYVLNQIVLTLLVRANINELVSQAIVLPVMVVLAFSMNRRFVFKRYDCSHH